MKTIRWGILGCGKIARKFASDLKWVANAQLIAVAAREQSTADAFAHDFPVRYKHGSYQALVENAEVDIVYIATPHAFHYEHTLLCLKHKKAVLCEKAFAINYKQAKEMIETAKRENVFLMEAFWTKFLPHYQKMKEMIAEGKIGTIQNIATNFGFIPTRPIAPRIYDPQLGGGSLLDIGVYPIFLVLDLLGRPDEIEAHATFSDQGTDSQCAVQFSYHSGALAQLFSTFHSNLATAADIGGDCGRILLTHRFHGPTTNLEYYPGIVDTRETISFEAAKGNGYEYEAQHATDCLLQGMTESPIRPFSDTLLLMETLDRIRVKAGIYYPADDH
ncbi:MAG: Gfo/Idh/MocA family oxidoreductase [Bacteroidetes bacterium]|nr:Gfo/Idh/MocA family oxidoreductase [Bacteroidota bacterium]MBS1539066.1 Gfo/Idh/MocA family oxidoreductase [Bacteroidota bacterium]